MGKVFDFIHATNDVLTERGIELPVESQSTTTPETRLERGLAIQKEIVGAELIDQMYTSARLSKLLLRHGIRFDDGAAWTQRHREWLQTVTLEWPAAPATMLDARGAIDALAHRREQLEREIVAMLPSSPWVVQVGRLPCLRGVDTLTAVGCAPRSATSNASPAPSS